MPRLHPSLPPKAALVACMLLLWAACACAQFPRPQVDPAVATTGAKLYAHDCAHCHGSEARGGSAPDLIRSVAVLHDRREMLHGKELGPLLANTPDHHFKYNDRQLDEISQFLTLSINNILRSGYDSEPKHLLDGDARAGEAYFHGEGGCSRCHSATGDLAHVGTRFTAVNLQQKWLFPGVGRDGKKPQATVKLPGGQTYTGSVTRSDDYTLTLRDEAGRYHSFNRTPAVHITVVDPLAEHAALLHKYTDADIHNMTTYLAMLK